MSLVDNLFIICIICVSVPLHPGSNTGLDQIYIYSECKSFLKSAHPLPNPHTHTHIVPHTVFAFSDTNP